VQRALGLTFHERLRHVEPRLVRGAVDRDELEPEAGAGERLVEDVDLRADLAVGDVAVGERRALVDDVEVDRDRRAEVGGDRRLLPRRDLDVGRGDRGLVPDVAAAGGRARAVEAAERQRGVGQQPVALGELGEVVAGVGGRGGRGADDRRERQRGEHDRQAPAVAVMHGLPSRERCGGRR
jgi:hypothetical protein